MHETNSRTPPPTLAHATTHARTLPIQSYRSGTTRPYVYCHNLLSLHVVGAAAALTLHTQIHCNISQLSHRASRCGSILAASFCNECLF